MSNKLKALYALGDELVGSTKAQTRARTGYQTQAQIGQVAASPLSGAQGASILAAHAAGQNVGQQVQQQQTQQQLGQQMAQVAMGQQAQTAQEQEFQRGMRTQEMQLQNENRLARLSMEKKNELLDLQYDFQKDEAGRTLFNQRQLLDFAALKAENVEELENYKQEMQQASDRKLRILEAMHKKITQTMQLDSKAKIQRLDQQAKREIIALQRELEQAYMNEKARASNIQGAFTAAGTIIGASFGAPGIGYAAGSAAGTLATQ